MAGGAGRFGRGWLVPVFRVAHALRFDYPGRKFREPSDGKACAEYHGLITLLGMATSGTDPLFAFRYPIGCFATAVDGVPDRKAAIAILAALPENLRSAVSGLDDSQLDTPYREGGWTVRQVVHHVAESHAQA